MNTVQFRYGFHPEGVDPLAALRAPRTPRTTQASTVACGPSPSALSPRQNQLGVPAGRKVLAIQPPKAPSVPRRGGSWGAVLWIAAVSASMGIGGLVWAFDQGAAATEPEPMAMAFAAPTILEPDPLPAPRSVESPSEAIVSENPTPVSRAPVATAKPSAPPVVASVPAAAEPAATPPAAAPPPPTEPTAPARPADAAPTRPTPVVVAKVDPPLMAPVARIPRSDLLQPKPSTEQPASPKLRVPAMSTKTDAPAGRIVRR
jgi:translation initiation factor IF-2